MREVNKVKHTNQLNGVSARLAYALLMLSIVLLSASGAYLALITLLENVAEQSLENVGFQYVFAIHIVGGIPFVLLLLGYLWLHLTSVGAINNQKARKAGMMVILVFVGVSVSGLLLTSVVPEVEVVDPLIRRFVYLLHVLVPVLGIYVYYHHRNKGRNKLSTKAVSHFLLLILVFGGCFLGFTQYFDNRSLSIDETSKHTFPNSLVKAKGSGVTHVSTFKKDQYCKECHNDAHAQWEGSAHRFSSFNNPYYRFSILNTRKFVLERDGDVSASNFCAGCHDPIPLLSGDFAKNDFDVDKYESASAGLTCTFCHSIQSVDSPIGVSDFTVESPVHYPFAFSESSSLRWFSNLLVKSNPDFHKNTFLKPVHKSTEFCGSCHKVHIPEELNGYKWLRGQNHYDSFLQSGVSGVNVDSFYYPKEAHNNCNGCHMKTIVSEDKGAKIRDVSLETSILDHSFASGNTALAPTLLDDPHPVVESHKSMLIGSLRLDLIGIREGGEVAGEFQLLDEGQPVSLEPGKTYLLELVVRTLKLGHAFTNGTSDSNQIWIEIALENQERVIGQSGVLDDEGYLQEKGTHLLQNFLVDSEGNRILERNVEDNYTTVKNHQLPPGAADVIHYKFNVPENYSGENIVVTAKLNYRKFSKLYSDKSLTFSGMESLKLPVVTIARDSFAVSNGVIKYENPKAKPAKNERINDYGIGLLRKPGKKQFNQAEQAFNLIKDSSEQALLNLVRLYYKQGNLDKATEYLTLLKNKNLSNPWSAEWYSALINIDRGFIEEGVTSLEKIYQVSNWASASEKKFDFSKDFKVLTKLAQSTFLLANYYGFGSEGYSMFIARSKEVYNRLLDLDPENVHAHFGLSKLYKQSGDAKSYKYHKALYEKYKQDENAVSKAVTAARNKDDYLDEIANSVIIYPLN